MLRYAVRRIVHTVVVLLIVSAALSFLIDLTPGDPAYAILGDGATPEAVDAVHRDLGLDRPVHERYRSWLGGLLTGDFGMSYQANTAPEARRPVLDLIREALPVTLELVVLTIATALVVSVAVAMYAASHVGGRFDRGLSLALAVFVSTPAFVVIPLLVYVLAVKTRLLPPTGWVPLSHGVADNLRHMVLPSMSLSLTLLPHFTTALRTDLNATLREDFILSARAKGLSPARVLFGHALRPSSFSLLTLAGLSMGSLLGGALIAEILFVLPGIGTLMVNAINSKDVNTVQGVAMFIALAYVTLNTLLDLAYRAIDPRVRAAVA